MYVIRILRNFVHVKAGNYMRVYWISGNPPNRNLKLPRPIDSKF